VAYLPGHVVNLKQAVFHDGPRSSAAGGYGHSNSLWPPFHHSVRFVRGGNIFRTFQRQLLKGQVHIHDKSLDLFQQHGMETSDSVRRSQSTSGRLGDQNKKENETTTHRTHRTHRKKTPRIAGIAPYNAQNANTRQDVPHFKVSEVLHAVIIGWRLTESDWQTMVTVRSSFQSLFATVSINSANLARIIECTLVQTGGPRARLWHVARPRD
jgi:hypothetical protein